MKQLQGGRARGVATVNFEQDCLCRVANQRTTEGDLGRESADLPRQALLWESQRDRLLAGRAHRIHTTTARNRLA
ncbi:Zn(II)2Cys6 transcription factor [Aspergillus luchuensis]|uniref:Zn(II)2Cys6 transcription factor n=1 Tax=Aspergillus kawachii TaxID=1069201 RepID=A0A146FE11_ASPKA|nr:Zn(II)2Cys6 transcription factor [Aspergillus luchuensis]